MATQGVVSVVEAGKVIMKIVVGTEGMRAKDVGAALREAWPVTAEKAYDIAKRIGFGSSDCRVVATETETVFRGENEDPPTTYQATLQKPEWNPRWGNGTADHTIVVEV